MNKAKKATDPCELERQVLDVHEPKTETEWWARDRILELEAQLAQAQFIISSILDLIQGKNIKEEGEEDEK